MPVIETIKRAFLSYSARDRACVNRLVADLRRNGVEVWVDFEGLVPGTPDWETSIRHAVDQSFSLLLVASPNSRQSPYVRSEVLLAQSKGLPIYAVWAAGEEWIDSIPLSLAHVQYQDLRGAAYDEGLKTLLRELERWRMTLPRHFLYKDFYRRFADKKAIRIDGRERVDSTYSVPIGRKPIPDGFIMIIRKSMVGFWETSESCDAIAVKPSAYSTANQVINEIYLEYLKDDYPPFTYGDRWLLREDTWDIKRLALHWSYVLGDVRPNGVRLLSQMVEPPEVYGLVAEGTRWMISEGRPAHPVVFAAHDLKILRVIQNNIKIMMTIIDPNYRITDDLFAKVEPDNFRKDDYKFVVLYDLDYERLMCTYGPTFGNMVDAIGKVFVQKTPTSELLYQLRGWYFV